MEIKHTHTHTQTYGLRRRMADDPGKDKKRKKRKIEHGKLRFGPQQTKQQQNNIIPFPSLITNKTEQTRDGNKTHTHTHTPTNLQTTPKNGR